MAQPDHAADWSQLSDPERNAALEVLVHGPLSRSDLARRIGLSPGSLTRLAGSLLQRGILREDDVPHTTTTGRQGRGLRVVTEDHRFIGVRLTGGAVDAVLTDMEATSLSTVSKPLANTDPDTVTQTITQAVAELGSGIPAEGRAVSSLGVGVGGQVAPDGSVLSAVFLGWENVRITDRLRELTGVETHLENDVVALTAAEHWFGAGRGRPDLGMLTIGTGVGSGLVMHHKVVASIDAGVGLLGHLPLGMPGPMCPMGHVGCATAVLTEASLVAQASVALGQPVGLAELFTLAARRSAPSDTTNLRRRSDRAWPSGRRHRERRASTTCHRGGRMRAARGARDRRRESRGRISAESRRVPS